MGKLLFAATVDDNFRPFATNTRITLVNVIVPQPDEKFLVGGNFGSASGFNRNGIARFNPNGELDMTFTPAAGGQVSCIVLQPDGKILIAGFGVSAVINGINRNGIVRLNQDGSLDQSFSNGTGASIISYITLQSDGKIVVAGLFSTINGVARNRIARLNADASLDQTFAPQVSGEIRAVLSVRGDKVMVGGEFSSPKRNVARFNYDGTVDNSFSFESTFRVNTFKVQTDGRLLIGRFFNQIVEPSSRGVVRLNNDDTVDANFVADITDNFNPEVMSLEIQADGKVLVGGRFFNTNLNRQRGLYRLNLNGSLDGSFTPVENCLTLATSARPEGGIIIGGTRNGEDTYRNLLFGLNSQGVRDPQFPASVGNVGDVFAVTKSLDGKVYIAGNFVEVNGMDHKRIARLNRDGTIDVTFNSLGTNGIVYDLAVQADGKVVIVGDFGLVNGTARLRLARLNMDGSVDEGFQVGQGFDGAAVRHVLIQQDGKIIVAGQFNTYNGTPRSGIARLNADGSIDSNYDVKTSPTWSINALVRLDNGRRLIGGNFQSVNGNPIGRMARLNEDGTTDTSFNAGGSGADGPITSISLQSDRRIVIGGYFTNYNGVSRSSLARVLADGSLDMSFVASANNVNVVAAEPNGKILAGGNISSADGIARNCLARFNKDGTLDIGFDSGTGAGQSIYHIDVDANGDITIGGTFTLFGGQDHLSLAQVKVAFAEITGRVFTPQGRGLRNAVVAIRDRSGITSTATTSSFGFYGFSGIETGTSYTVSVQSRFFRFVTIDLPVSGNISDLDFYGLE